LGSSGNEEVSLLIPVRRRGCPVANVNKVEPNWLNRAKELALDVGAGRGVGGKVGKDPVAEGFTKNPDAGWRILLLFKFGNSLM
jgi:hypothetical protein